MLENIDVLDGVYSMVQLTQVGIITRFNKSKVHSKINLKNNVEKYPNPDVR